MAEALFVPRSASDRLVELGFRDERQGPAPRWYVVLAQPGNELLALRNLHRQGYEAFLPQHWVTRQRPRSRRGLDTRLRPVFPRYLFVSLDLGRQQWRSVNGSYGVSRLISFGDRPAPMPAGIAETMLESIGEDGALVFEQALAPGQQVRLLHGPFASQLGVLERLDDNGRVRLLLDLLGGKVVVSVMRDQIERVGKDR